MLPKKMSDSSRISRRIQTVCLNFLLWCYPGVVVFAVCALLKLYIIKAVHYWTFGLIRKRIQRIYAGVELRIWFKQGKEKDSRQGF